MLLRSESNEAEPALRRAIELLVDAFLLDRRNNAGCFARAHRLGAEAERRFGCRLRRDEADRWVNECGVLALHSRIGQSAGGVIHTKCSICGSSSFGCDHIEGETYSDRECSHVVHRWDVTEVSLTPRPHDPRCYRLSLPRTTDEVERELGRALRRDETPTCSHCASCYGAAGPNLEDLDPASFPDLPIDEQPVAPAERS